MNIMDVYEQILGAYSTEYTDQLHHWCMQGLSKKSRPKTVQDKATLADMETMCDARLLFVPAQKSTDSSTLCHVCVATLNPCG